MSESMREKFGPWAGNGYIASNVALTLKPGLEKAVEEGVPQYWERAIADPALVGHEFADSMGASASGIIFIGSSYILSKYGHTNRGTAASMFLATIGYGALDYEVAAPKYDGVTKVAAALATLGVIYGMGRALYDQYLKPKKTLENSSEEKRGFFKKYAGELVEKYPYLPTGATEVITSGMTMVGGVLANDPVLAGIGLGWTASSVLLGLSKPVVG